MHKYTVIYTERWMSGSCWHALTKMKRVELPSTENIWQQIIDIIRTEDIQYIFVGHPKLEGE